MATYKKLLYSIGGGIISDVQLDAQNGSATIAIGLGGTGKDAIKRLKKEIYQRIAPDNEGEVISRYSHIKYLSIDTDENDLWNAEDFLGIDSISEFFSIAGDPFEFIDIEKSAAIAEKPYAKWFEPRTIKFHPDDLHFHVTRQVGRYFLIDKSDALSRKLEEVFTAAVRDLDPNKPGSMDVNIHIMTSLGGGAGSGTFLDVCYLVRRIASICPALSGKHIRICGYFFMPDVNLSKIAQERARDYVMSNSFAAMKELDYCMSLEQNNDKWRQQYNGFEIETSSPPVDIAYLISSQSVAFNIVTNGYEYAMGSVSDCIIQSIVEKSFCEKWGMMPAKHLDMLIPKQHGGNYKYVIIGSSHSSVPIREISTYLASKLFEKMAVVWGNEPTDEDIAQFCDKIGLSCGDLKKDVGGFNITVPVIDNVYDHLPTDDSGDKYELEPVHTNIASISIEK